MTDSKLPQGGLRSAAMSALPRVAFSLAALLTACEATASLDAGALDARIPPGTDAPLPDSPGLDVFLAPPDASLPDAPGLDAPFDDAPATVDDAFLDRDAPAGPSALGDIVSRELFETMFLHRGSAPCRGAFYTYEAFLAAAATFPAFASEGDNATRRREVAALLANLGHETTGGWATAPDGPYAWGLCWITEGATVEPSALPDYCSPSAEWPCAPGQKYFGRGPMQLSWNYNYGQCGVALGLPLLTSPNLVASDPTVAFRTALWFWMTPQSPKPSCHDVMVGRFTPSAADVAAGRMAGFGLTIDIINGGLECGHGPDARVADRIGYFERFTSILGTDTGANVDCATMGPY